jgi:4-hydroxybenzoate polyprenyltransferase
LIAADMQQTPQPLWRRMRAWTVRIRLRYWLHFLVLPFAGVSFSLVDRAQWLSLLRGVCISFAVLTFGYLLNSVADREMDLDPEKSVLRGEQKNYRVELMVWVFIALVLSLMGPWLVVLCTALCIGCGWIYSVGPRLKAKPLIGTLLNVGNFAPLLFVGIHRVPGPSALPWIAGLFSALLLQNQLLHEAADAEEDRHGQLNTTFLKWGEQYAVWLVLLCGILVLFLSVYSLHVHRRSMIFALHALLYLVLFPAWLWRSAHIATRAVQPAMQRARKIHRWCCLGSGALMYCVLYGII